MQLSREQENRRIRRTEIEHLLEQENLLQVQSKQELLELEEILLEKKSTYERLFIQQGACSIRRHLHEGDICPVCANVITKPMEQDMAVEEELAELSAQIRELEQKKGSLMMESAGHQHQLDTLSKEKSELSKSPENDETQESTEALQEKIEKLENEYKELSGQKSQLEQEKKKLQEQEKQAMTDKINAAAQYGAVRTEIQRQASLQKQLEEQIQELEKMLPSAKEHGELRRQLEQMNRTLEQIETENKAIEEAESNRQQLLAEQEQLQKQETALELELNTLQTQSEGLIKNQQEQEQIILDRIGALLNPQETINQLERQIEELEKSYKTAQEAKVELDSREVEGRQQLAVIESSLLNLRNQAREMQEELYEKLEVLEIERFESLAGQEKVQRLKERIEWLKRQALSVQEMGTMEQSIANHHRLIAEKNGIIKSLQAKLGEKKISEEELLTIQEQNQALRLAYEELSKKFIGESREYRSKVEQYEKLKELYEKENKIVRQLDILKELKSVLGAKKFVDVVTEKTKDYSWYRKRMVDAIRHV